MNKCVLWMICCLITGISSAQTARYSVVINEFLPDPTPTVGLPNSEFIELKNTSNKAIQLEKWRIENGSTSAMINISYLLQPDSLVIICSKTQAVAFNLPSKTIGISSFPTLTNESGMIILKDATGKTIHAVSYDQSWYKSPTKSEGGWSLEMIDPTKACDDKNWQASINDSGGTPGKENSIVNIIQVSRKIQATQ
ncbi:MAG: lamin tail domain-containing protein, partial [bacterium]